MKPAPRPTAETEPFWAACARGVLTVQRCAACGRTQFPPRVLCSHCHADDLGWIVAAGRGRIHSCTVVHRAPGPAFLADMPYVLALIDLDEGVRMMMNVIGCAPAAVAIGMAVEVVFEPRGEAGLRLPQARLR